MQANAPVDGSVRAIHGSAFEREERMSAFAERIELLRNARKIVSVGAEDEVKPRATGMQVLDEVEEGRHNEAVGSIQHSDTCCLFLVAAGVGFYQIRRKTELLQQLRVLWGQCLAFEPSGREILAPDLALLLVALAFVSVFRDRELRSQS